MNKEQQIDPNDAKLQELIRWMLDSVTVRDMLKKLIEHREMEDNTWIKKCISGQYNYRPGDDDIFFRRGKF